MSAFDRLNIIPTTTRVSLQLICETNQAKIRLMNNNIITNKFWQIRIFDDDDDDYYYYCFLMYSRYIN